MARSSESVSVQRNSIFLFANGSMCKVPRCNVQLCKSEGDTKDKNEVSTENGDGVNRIEEEVVFEGESPRVSFEDTEEEEKEK